MTQDLVAGPAKLKIKDNARDIVLASIAILQEIDKLYHQWKRKDRPNIVVEGIYLSSKGCDANAHHPLDLLAYCDLT